MRRRHFLLAPLLFAPLPIVVSPAALAQAVAHGGIVVRHVWARAAAEEGMSSVVYLTIVNRGADDALTHARTPVATAAVLHQTRNDGGVMRMLGVASVPDSTRRKSGDRIALCLENTRARRPSLMSMTSSASP